jgi:hypothetical protein
LTIYPISGLVVLFMLNSYTDLRIKGARMAFKATDPMGSPLEIKEILDINRGGDGGRVGRPEHRNPFTYFPGEPEETYLHYVIEEICLSDESEFDRDPDPVYAFCEAQRDEKEAREISKQIAIGRTHDAETGEVFEPTEPNAVKLEWDEEQVRTTLAERGARIARGIRMFTKGTGRRVNRTNISAGGVDNPTPSKTLPPKSNQEDIKVAKSILKADNRMPKGRTRKDFKRVRLGKEVFAVLPARLVVD